MALPPAEAPVIANEEEAERARRQIETVRPTLRFGLCLPAEAAHAWKFRYQWAVLGHRRGAASMESSLDGRKWQRQMQRESGLKPIAAPLGLSGSGMTQTMMHHRRGDSGMIQMTMRRRRGNSGTTQTMMLRRRGGSGMTQTMMRLRRRGNSSSGMILMMTHRHHAGSGGMTQMTMHHRCNEVQQQQQQQKGQTPTPRHRGAGRSAVLPRTSAHRGNTKRKPLQIAFPLAGAWMCAMTFCASCTLAAPQCPCALAGAHSAWPRDLNAVFLLLCASATGEKRMTDGTRSGMVTGRELQEELARKREADRKRMSAMDASVTGRFAQTVRLMLTFSS